MSLAKISLIISLGAAATAVYAVACVLRERHEKILYIPVSPTDSNAQRAQFYECSSDELQVYSKRAPMLVYSDLIANDCEELKKIEKKSNVKIVVDNDFESTNQTFFMTITGKPSDAVIAEARIDDLLLKIVNKKCTPTHMPTIN